MARRRKDTGDIHIHVGGAGSAGPSEIWPGHTTAPGYRVSDEPAAGPRVKTAGSVVTVLAVVTAALNFWTAFKPYTWLIDQLGDGGSQSSTAVADTTDRDGPEQQSPVTPSPSPTTLRPTVPFSAVTVADAERAIQDYFDLAQRDDLDAMWGRLSAGFKRDTPGGRVAFDDWWGPGVIDFQGPHVSPGAEPVSDGLAVWVQFAIRFKEDHVGAFPNSIGWVDKYSVYWYRVVNEDGRLVIDGQKARAGCPLELSAMKTCAGQADRHLSHRPA